MYPVDALNFNPRSPCGERHLVRFQTQSVPDISIHAPRVGSDLSFCRRNRYSKYFNPRSPCGERPLPKRTTWSPKLFQSTLPVWGATYAWLNIATPFIISIHAPRVGSDLVGEDDGRLTLHFNPRSPCGERRQARFHGPNSRPISIHAPRVGSDSKDAQIFLLHLRQKGCFCVIFSKLGAIFRGSAEKGGGGSPFQIGANLPGEIWVLGVRVQRIRGSSGE